MTLEEIESAFKGIENSLRPSGQKGFEGFWEKAITAPEFGQVIFMKKIFETIYLGAYVDGGSEAIMQVLEAFATVKK